MAASKKQKNKRKVSANYRPAGSWLWPIALALAVIPLIVHTYTFDTGLSRFDWYPDEAGLQTDFFLFYKMIAIIVVMAVMTCILLFRLSKSRKEMPWEKPFFLMAGYAALCFISFLFSRNKDYAAGGGYEMFESVWVVVGYVIIMYYCYATIKDEQDIIKIFIWASIGIGIVYLIGLFQYVGLDFFKSDFGKRLILDDTFWAAKDEITFTFAPGDIYTTLYNINFVGLYVGGLLPVFAVLTFVDKKVWRKIIWGAFTAASPIMIYGSRTDSAFVALAAGVIFALLVLAMRKKITAIIAGAVAVLAVVGGIVYLNIPAGEELKLQITGGYYLDEVYPITSVLTKEDGVEFKTENDTLFMSWDEEDIRVLGSDGQAVSMLPKEDSPETKIISNAGDFDNSELIYEIQMNYDEASGEYTPFTAVQLTTCGTTWIFTNSLGDGGYWYNNAVGKWVQITDRKYVRAFPELLFSGRGTIWNRALPVLKDCIFIGKGANNFITAFPQDEYITEAYYNSMYTYDVKAHFWLLQMAVEEGILAVLLFLGFYFWYVVRAIMVFRRGSLKDSSTWLVLAFLIGTVIYMVAAIANDSTVGTGIVMWVDLGMGLAANKIAEVKQKQCLEEEQSN